MADFETATWLENETYVWAWCFCEIGNENNIYYGNNITNFFETLNKFKNPIVYFHNLAFDGEFILYWLLTNGFEYREKEKVENRTFTTLISDLGQFYSITIYFKKGNKEVKKITFYDSLKIIPFKVEEVSKTFGIEEKKLSIDYKKPRKKGHKLTNEEIEYIKNDVVIMSKALKICFDENLTRMTRASNALADFKEICGKSKFEHFFPRIKYEIDKDIRRAYKGGFTYLSPEYKEKDVKNGIVLDVNSLYPYVMYDKPIPFGNPVFFKGKYKDDNIYNLYIQLITCEFKIKKDKIPTIQIKHGIYKSNEYLTSSDGEIVSLVLTSVDLKLFLEHYDVYNLEYVSGWKFKSTNRIFREYIEKWIEIKNNATLNHNLGKRTLAKLMLNSLYGKLATSTDVAEKIPYLTDEGIVKYNITDYQVKDGLYIPAGCFITAWARDYTIRTSQKIMDYSINKYGKNLYIYSDTDSIHCLLDIEELKNFCKIDDVKLGYWKHESNFKKARFIRQKTYIEDMGEYIKITCAGLPESCYKNVNFNNFHEGFKCKGKLRPKHVKGGIILEDSEFTLKSDLVKNTKKKVEKK